MERLIRAILHKRAIVILIAFAVAVAGVFSYIIIPKEENPDTSVAAAVITTIYPGASAKEVETEVTNVIENELKKLSGIDYFTSKSMNSVSAIIVMYELHIVIEDVEQKLRQAVEDAGQHLPELSGESVVETDVVSDNQFIISLSGENYSNEELVEFSKDVKVQIENVEGIESVTVDGEQEKELIIELEAEKISEYNINTQNIIAILNAQNLSIPSGVLKYENENINVVANGTFNSIDEIEDLIIASDPQTMSVIRLKDIANISVQSSEDFYYSQDGLRAVMLTGKIEEGQNAVAVGDKLREVIDEEKENLPSDLIFHEVMYAPETIANSINDFTLNLIASVALIVVVVMIGVHLRNAIVVSVALPLSILSAFIVMYLTGVDFHFISISALIVSLGILVDNAIVVSEAIQQNINKQMEKSDAIVKALKTTAVPILTSTLTTIVTFSIIYFIPGAVGKVAGTIPTVVITTLVASYIIAMTVIPVLAFWFFKPENEKRIEKESIVKKIFKKLLGVSLKHKIATVFVSFLSLGVAALLALGLGLQFFPIADKPVIYMNIDADVVSLSNTTEICEQVNELLGDEDVVENYSYAVGKGLPSFFLTVPTTAQSENVAQYMLQLDEDVLGEIGSIETVIRDIQTLMDENIDGATLTVKGLEYSVPTQETISLSVSGEDLQKVEEVAEDLQTALEEIEGTDRVRDTSVSKQNEYSVDIDKEKLQTIGFLNYDVLSQINTAIMGTNAGVYKENDASLDIVVKTDIETEEDLEELTIISSTTQMPTKLSEIADINTVESVPLINHYNGENQVYVLSAVLPGFNSYIIESELNENYISKMDLEGITITSIGEVSNMLDLVVALGISALFAVVVIYIILMFQFNNLRKPFIILTSIPLSFIGCGFGLFIFNMDIQAMALLGLVTLFGIVVNNSILLIEATDSYKLSGQSLTDSCKLAMSDRFRPIMLASITTCIGLVPLIMSGDSMTSPMASVLLFGLLFSTLLTMIVVPTLYAVHHK